MKACLSEVLIEVQFYFQLDLCYIAVDKFFKYKNSSLSTGRQQLLCFDPNLLVPLDCNSSNCAWIGGGHNDY